MLDRGSVVDHRRLHLVTKRAKMNLSSSDDDLCPPFVIALVPGEALEAARDSRRGFGLPSILLVFSIRADTKIHSSVVKTVAVDVVYKLPRLSINDYSVHPLNMSLPDHCGVAVVIAKPIMLKGEKPIIVVHERDSIAAQRDPR